MVFQDALAALNPVHSVGYQLTEVLRVRRGIGRGDGPPAGDRAARHGQGAAGRRPHPRLPAPVLRRHAPAGDDRRRPGAWTPRCSSPTSRPRRSTSPSRRRSCACSPRSSAERHMGLVLITHDLGVVATVADDVTVMYAGHAVEQATVRADLRRAGAPVHAGAAAGDAAPGDRRHDVRRGAGRSARRHPRAAAAARRGPGRLPVPPALRRRARRVPHDDAAAGGARRADGPACATWRPRSWRRPVAEPVAEPRRRTGDAILEVRDLAKVFPVRRGVVLRRTVGEVQAVDGVSFTLRRGRTLGLVGESGSGQVDAGADAGRRRAADARPGAGRRRRRQRRCRGRRGASCAAGSRWCSRTRTRR